MANPSATSYTEPDTRSFLKKGDTITLLRRNPSRQPMEFTIRALAGCGGTAVCYLAEANGQRGRLKEFYPREIPEKNIYYFLERSETNQLVSIGDGMRQRFAAMCADFVQAYDTLEAAKRKNTEFELLNNFIPPCEILLGQDEEGNPSSVYVWTANDKFGKNFEDYIREVRAHPDKLPEHKLYNILNTLVTLTDCIRVIHSADLLHLDIKPANFLVPYDGEMNINTNNISLFDVNSLYAPDGGIPKYAGTDGFRAPELLKGTASIWSDIYSIGAMLFYGIIVNASLPQPHYREAYYPNLEQLVEDSTLIQSCKSASSPSVRFLLQRILQKCLAHNPKRRYESCDALMADLIMARTYLIPDIFGKHLGLNKRLAILDVESAADRNPTAIMQDLLYRSPLYSTQVALGEPIRVLVIGAGTYGQVFMDLCLQTGQMHYHPLQIIAASRDMDLNKSVYLHYRPALSAFVDVDGAGCGGEEPYAKLDFVELAPGFEKGNVRVNRASAAQLLEQYPCQYIFISLGEDSLNYDVAKAFHDQKPGCPIHFVVQTDQRRDYPKGSPVYVNQSLAKEGISRALDDMAFSTHLSWCDAAALDMSAEKKRFREKYNYQSSLSFALSIPYKLKGITPLSDDPAQLAQDYARNVLGEDDTLFRSLVALEHRRWVLEKVTQGWTAPKREDGSPDYEMCIRRGRVSDAATKTHPCILRSTEATPMKQPGFDWDNAPEGLDPLDTLSVELHRAFRQAAEDFQRTQPLENEDILALRHLSEGCEEPVVQAFRRYLLCLQRILEGVKSYAKNYRQYEEDFTNAIMGALPDAGDEVKQRLKRIGKSFFASRESCMFRNYKQNDEVLVRNIPYILTNRHQPYLAMAFDDAQSQCGRNDLVFANVASASVLHPAKLTYLYIWRKDTSPTHFCNKVSVVLQYLERRHIRSRVVFLIAVPETVPDPRGLLSSQLEALRESTGLSEYVFIPCRTEEDAPQALLSILCNRRTDLFDGSTRLFNSQALSSQFLSHILEKDIPYCEFDRDTQTFPIHTNCEYLRYIRGGACLRLEDMFALMNAEDNKYHIPEFANDYKALWDIYTGAAHKGPFAYRNAVTNWTQLCLQLSAYFDRKDSIADLSLDPAAKGFDRHMVFYIPGFGYRAAKKLVELLVEENVVTPKSTVYTHTSDSCRIDLYSPWNLFGVFERIFANPCLLADPGYLDVESYYQGNYRHVVIKCSHLVVKELVLEDRFSYTVLEQLYRKRFIANLVQKEDNPQCVSFTITSPRMKKLLTCAGEILEIYCYYEILNTGYFDDLACGYEFKGMRNVVSEIDCVMTKGFRSILVECKARKQLDQNFYHKLQSISEQFGIGMKRVLISNSYETSNQLEEVNQMQISRGNQMGIITIHKPEEIMHIGQTMRQIMDGTYQEE